MSIIDDANDRSTLSTSILIPVSSDKTPLSWDGNDATLLGLLHEVGRHYRNKGFFQTLLRDRAVAGEHACQATGRAGSSSAQQH